LSSKHRKWTHPTARVPLFCYRCKGTIAAGERYHKYAYFSKVYTELCDTCYNAPIEEDESNG
jgi:hypothetical protein